MRGNYGTLFIIGKHTLTHTTVSNLGLCQEKSPIKIPAQSPSLPPLKVITDLTALKIDDAI